MAQNKGKGTSTVAKTGIGLAALAAAAAGAYYFYGSKHSAQHRRKMKSWMVKAKGEVMEKMERMKDITKDTYEAAVNQVVDKYSRVKSIPPEELTALATELRGHWNRIAGHLNTSKPKRKPAKTKSVK